MEVFIFRSTIIIYPLYIYLARAHRDLILDREKKK